jgi:hypothetical protein
MGVGMASEKKYVGIWLHDEAAKLFLGLPMPTTKSRWEILGKLESGESGVGIWVEIDVLNERKGPDSKVARTWKGRPPLCLIKWSYIITIQVHGEEVKKSARFGFQPA